MGGVRTRRAVAILLLAAAVAIACAGCGGSSSTGGSGSASPDTFTPYETAMQALGVKLYATLASLGKANISGKPVVIERNLRRSQAQLRHAAAELTKITPPARIKADHEELIRGVLEYANELSPIITDLKEKKKIGVIGAILRLKGIKDMTAASNAIAKAGYVISGSG
jgi:tellurite resistance protein